MGRGKIVLPDRHVMNDISNSGYKYLGILETDQLKERETKDLFSKEYTRMLKLVLKTKLNGKIKSCLQTHGQLQL